MTGIPKITLPDSVEIPVIGYGLASKWYQVPENDNGVNSEIVNALAAALNLGLTHVDSAHDYANEASVGAAIQLSGKPRDSLFITTKIYDGLHDIRGVFTQQLIKLGVDYVDLLLIHTPIFFGTPGYPTNEEAWKIMEELKDAGAARSIGVSNYRLSDLEKTLAVARHFPSVNQIELHPYVLERSLPLLSYMKENNIQVAAYGILRPIHSFSGGILDSILADTVKAVQARQVDKEKNVEPQQVLLNWARQQGWVLITSTRFPLRMQQIIETTDLPPLLASEMDSITNSGKGKHQREYELYMDEENE